MASELGSEGDFIEKYSGWFAIALAIVFGVVTVVEAWREGEPLVSIIFLGLFVPLILAFFLNLGFLLLFHIVYYSSKAWRGLREKVDDRRLWRRLR